MTKPKPSKDFTIAELRILANQLLLGHGYTPKRPSPDELALDELREHAKRLGVRLTTEDPRR